MNSVSRRLAFIPMVVVLMAMGIAVPRKAAADCSCRPDLIQVTTDAIGFSNNGCFQARNRCTTGVKGGADDICLNLGYMGGACNYNITYGACEIYQSRQYSVYCEVVAGCIVCT